MSVAIEDFRKTWAFVRSMTRSYIEAVPVEKWHFTPAPAYGPLCKQFRHMVWVSGLYNAALVDRVLDMAKKKASYGGSLERADLLAGLAAKDAELDGILTRLAAEPDGMRIDFFGTSMALGEFLHVLLEHEANHHGLWSLYANLGGFATPASWRENWGL